MAPKNTGIKTDFSHFVNMALQDRMTWKTLATLLHDFAPTLNETREVISILLKELETLYLAFQAKEDELRKYQEKSETYVVTTKVYDHVSMQGSETVTEINEVKNVSERPEEGISEEMLLDVNEDSWPSEENKVLKIGDNVEIEGGDNELQYRNTLEKRQGIDNGWYTFISNDKQTDTKTLEFQPELEDSEYEIKSSNDEHNAAMINSDDSLIEMNNQWKAIDKYNDTELGGSESAVRKTKKMPFQCKFCKKSFQKSSSLKYHIRIHTKVPFHCEICNKEFKTKAIMKQHEIIHTAEMPYECNSCNKRFKRKEHVKIHEVIHTGEVPFECKTCAKRFKRKGDLKQHEMIHTGEVPFECNTCRKRFKLKGELKKHERIHTGEVPYECMTCKKRFSHLSALKLHERNHTGEKPYECGKCGKKFKQSSALKYHEKHHK